MHRPGYINEQRKRELLYFLNKKKTFFCLSCFPVLSQSDLLAVNRLELYFSFNAFAKWLQLA